MMEIEFKCPHCGVVTFFDGSHLGENWNCRQCDNKVTISLQKKTPGRRERDDFADAEDFKSRHEIAPVCHGMARPRSTVPHAAPAVHVLRGSARRPSPRGASRSPARDTVFRVARP